MGLTLESGINTKCGGQSKFQFYNLIFYALRGEFHPHISSLLNITEYVDSELYCKLSLLAGKLIDIVWISLIFNKYAIIHDSGYFLAVEEMWDAYS